MLLSFAAAWFLAWPIWRAQFLIEIWPTEAWNGYFQDAAAKGLPLYPAADGLVGNNYPPLSFYGIGLPGKALGIDNLFAGRAVSVIALLAIAIEIFLAVRVLVGGRAGAAIGALWYVAIMARNQTTYVGANDPQLAGEAIMGAGLVWFLSRCRDGRSPVPALLLMVLAGPAGKPFVADEFKLEELALTGKGKEADVASMLDARRISSFANTGLAGADASLLHWWRGNP